MRLGYQIAASAALATAFVISVVGKVEAATLARNSSPISNLNTGIASSSSANTVSNELADKLQAALNKAVQDYSLPGATVGISPPQGTWFGASGFSTI